MKVFQKSVPLGHDFLQVVEFFYQKCEGEDFCVFVETAKKIWFRAFVTEELNDIFI